MKYLTAIFNAVNQNWTSRIFSLVLIVSVSYSILRITEAKTDVQGCVSCHSERNELIKALIDIRRELEPTANLNVRASLITFASFDTVRPQVQQQQVQRVKKKIDSLLLKYKIKNNGTNSGNPKH